MVLYEKDYFMKIINLIFASFALIAIMLPLQNVYSEEEVYGWNLMSEQERIQHQETMRNLKTNEERERYRIEHHEKMKQRAQERGVTIPEMPRDRMRNNGMGSGMGSGMGGGKGR